MQKMKELEVQLEDLQFENQKYIQKICDIEQQNKYEAEKIKQEEQDIIKEKDRMIKQLKGQRDCMFAEIQSLRNDVRGQQINKVSIISTELKDAYDNEMGIDD